MQDLSGDNIINYYLFHTLIFRASDIIINDQVSMFRINL